MNDDNASRMILLKGGIKHIYAPRCENNLSEAILSICKGFVFQIFRQSNDGVAAGGKSVQNECRLIQIPKGLGSDRKPIRPDG